MTWPRGYKKNCMLNSTKHEIFPAHKCYYVNNCWLFNIFEQEKSILGLSELEKMLNFLILFF